jgi:prepilin-type processing-associated H-X9-DG protein
MNTVYRLGSAKCPVHRFIADRPQTSEKSRPHWMRQGFPLVSLQATKDDGLSHEKCGNRRRGLPTCPTVYRLAGMRIAFLVMPVALMLAQSVHAPIENEYVRVVWATDKPVAKPGSLHEHKQNRVMIYLDSGTIQIAYADGHVEKPEWKAGDIAWSPASGMHTSQNVGTTPVRIVEIEVRKGSAEMKAGAYKSIDNAQVHVYRSAKAPAAGKHYVAVDGVTGDASWEQLPAGTGPFVIVEMK